MAALRNKESPEERWVWFLLGGESAVAEDAEEAEAAVATAEAAATRWAPLAFCMCWSVVVREGVQWWWW
jgi:hypothetical protein